MLLSFHLFRFLVIAGALFASIQALAKDDDGAYTITKPERAYAQVEKAYADMAPVKYEPLAQRWVYLPITKEILGRGQGELRVVMLGDSIVNDTSRSQWDQVLAAAVKVKIAKVTCVRGSTGCWWYKEEGRVKKFVLDHKPDLLIIGGISQRDDIDSIRNVIEQVRKAGSKCEVLLMTGAFGHVDPRDDKQWSYDFDPKGTSYRAKLARLASEEKCGFLDMTAHWGKYIRDSGKELTDFKRDAVHANEKGEQIIGRILAKHLTP